MRVKVIPLRDPAKILRCLRACSPLCDARREAGLAPEEFWTPGTYFPGPRFVNCYLIVLRPFPEKFILLGGPVGVAREAAYLLEKRWNAILDWCAGSRGESVWLFAKPRAFGRLEGKEVRVRPDRGDIMALVELIDP